MNVSRAEAWSFFEPPEDGGDPTYALVGNRATLGVHVVGARFELQGAFQYAQLVGLPPRSIGPGPLGPGASFFYAAGGTRAYQLYFRSMSLRVKNVAPHLSIEAGRMAYQSGEQTPMAGRLVGTAEWTMFERAFDGVRLDFERPGWRAHASFVMPTQGAFEESANPTMTAVRVATVSWTRGGVQLFAHDYRDRRRVSARPDNSGLGASAVDIDVQTFGGFIARELGAAAVHAWGAMQRGDWYGDPHRAFSALVEARYHWAAVSGRPAVGGGLLYASGDGEPNDRRHDTFFPMVPTTRPGVLGATYAQMNLRDLYLKAELHPREDVTLSAELHRLSLAQALDRWYSGTGATAFRGEYFGYSTRPSGLQTGLGTFAQISAEAPLRKYWRIKASAGFVKGGGVVRRQFAGDWLSVFVLESTLAIR